MLISNCCEAVFCEPGYPDNDMCSDCKEHAEAIEINPTVSETYKNMLDTPQGNMRWREKIRFVKESG